MKKIYIVLIILISILGLSSCDYQESSNNETAKKQEQIMTEITRSVGMPGIVNFQEKKLAKMIFELRDKEKLSTYTYITAKNTGKQLLLCKSIGYGLPYSIQYTNPLKMVDRYGNLIDGLNREVQIIPQADPNGLFMPEGLSATWVMCINKSGNPKPVYVENEIIVSPFKLF